MTEHTVREVERDITVYIEKSGVFLECTFDCKYNVITERIGNGDRRTSVEWIDRTLIKVEYWTGVDPIDNEYRWIYGEDMHPKISSVVDTFNNEIQDQLEKAAKP